MIVVHHIVFDAWSYGVLLRELAALYAEAVGGPPAGLPTLSVQFADYALWERQRLADSRDELVEFWRDTLAGFENLQLPTDRPRPVLESFQGKLKRHRLGESAAAGVAALARQRGTTPFVVLLATLQALLSRYTGQHDIVIGAPSANRGRSKLQPLIGFLVNTLPMRTDLSGDPTFLELLDRTHRSTVGAYAHQELPLASLVDAIEVTRDPGRSPVFSVLLTAADEPAELRAGGLRMRLEKVDLPAAKFDLAFFAETCSDGLWLEVTYASDLFDPETIDRLLAHYRVLLAGGLAEPGCRLSELPMLEETELFAELVGWNSTATEQAGSGCIHQLFEAQVASRPDAIAAVFGDQRISYQQLNARANQLARWLIGQQIRIGSLVGIAAEPSIDRLVSLLAILKAGAGYLPLDPVLPVDRLSFMLTDAAVELVLTDQPTLTGLQCGAVQQLAELWPAIAELDATELTEQDQPSDAEVAYLLYTSGSTGQPKGVLVEHRQVVNFALGMIEAWQLGPADRVLQFASLSFDVSVLDMFCCLLAGGCAVLADRDTKLSPPRLGALMRDQRVSFCCLPPVLLGLLADQEFPELRVLISAGEELPTEVARRWLRPGLRLVNGYGPTETTVLSLFAEVDGRRWPAPIGLPLPNYQAYVLDPQLNPVPVGVPGELHIGGSGLARGYLNRPELSTQRFILDPFSQEPDARLYRTGDLVKRLPDGRIEFLGRLDAQVKIRGLRVEPGEIETVLSRHPRISQAIVQLELDRTGEQFLAGYLRRSPADQQPGQQPVDAELIEYLSRWLPAYMIPTRLHWLDAFPLNPSGKVDRKALAGLAGQSDPEQPADRPVEPPASPTEQRLRQIYAELLRPDRLGVLDSFFQIGGNSLQAMQLVSRIHDEFGLDLPVTAVFLSPEVRGLAGRIDRLRTGQQAPAAAGLVLELTEASAGEALFLVHAVGGTVFGYQELASELAGSYRVFAIQAAALSDQCGEPAGPPPETIEELAARYLVELRAAQPTGPYRLGGWSMGGLLAHQIVHQLEAAGEQVALLVLLDAPFAIAADWASDAQLAGQFVADALRTLGRQQPDPAAGQPERGPSLEVLVDALDPAATNLQATEDEVRRRLAVFSRHRRLMSGYQPAGAVLADTVLVSADHSPNAVAQRDWPVLIKGKLTVAELDTDHYGLLRAPLVHQVAGVIRAAGAEQ